MQENDAIFLVFLSIISCLDFALKSNVHRCVVHSICFRLIPHFHQFVFTLKALTLIQFSLCSILATNLMSQISFHKSLATVMHRNFVWLK